MNNAACGKAVINLTLPVSQSEESKDAWTRTSYHGTGRNWVAPRPLPFRPPLSGPTILKSYVTAILWNEVFLSQRKDVIPLIDFGTHSIADVN